MNIKGKTAIVTGGASGLGESAVRRLYNGGANVVIVDLNEELGKAMEKELGEKGLFIKADISSEDDVKALMNATMEKYGAVHILVNSAGIASIGKTIGKGGALPLDAFKKTINVNLIGSFNTLSKAAWEMSKNEPENGECGVIVNVASVAAFEGQIGQIAYAASKAAIVGMTLPAARDLSSNGIRVCTIAPGIFLTPMMATLPEAARESLGKQVPCPSRLGNVEEFAALVEHIVQNAYMNGETIRLDGAIRMGPR